MTAALTTQLARHPPPTPTAAAAAVAVVVVVASSSGVKRLAPQVFAHTTVHARAHAYTHLLT